jgi:hypothetical protein
LLAGFFTIFIFLALSSLVFAVLAVDRNELLLVCYCLWIACLGAIGAIAFLSMNALAIQRDVTFDLTNTSLLAVRIALGVLFGIVLSIPFGFHGFAAFAQSLARGATDHPADLGLVGVLPLLLPFILGFSTSLVILILNRLLKSITVFFGGGGDTQ